MVNLLRINSTLLHVVYNLAVVGVNWVIRVDKKKAISFCAVQSKAAEPYLLLCGVTREDVLRRFVFIEGPGEIHHASTGKLYRPDTCRSC